MYELQNTVKETNYWKAIKLAMENDYLRNCKESDEHTHTLILQKNNLERNYRAK
jgi:hypothetical protein